MMIYMGSNYVYSITLIKVHLIYCLSLQKTLMEQEKELEELRETRFKQEEDFHQSNKSGNAHLTTPSENKLKQVTINLWRSILKHNSRYGGLKYID